MSNVKKFMGTVKRVQNLTSALLLANVSHTIDPNFSDGNVIITVEGVEIYVWEDKYGFAAQDDKEPVEHEDVESTLLTLSTILRDEATK